MSHFSEIVSLLCQSHLLLAVTFVAFISLERAATVFSVTIPFSGQLRWAQVLILLSLSVPTAIHFLPPTIVKSEFQLPIESRNEKAPRKARPVSLPPAPPPLCHSQNISRSSRWPKMHCRFGTGFTASPVVPTCG